VLNLSSRPISENELIVLGKGLGFCPRYNSHDKVRLAEEVFHFSRRLRLKEYFNDLLKNDINESDDNNQKEEYQNLPFYNKTSSTFTPPSGRDIYLDFYFETISNEIMHSSKQKRFRPNVSKQELQSLKDLSRDTNIVIKKADKSKTIVIMDKKKYIDEVNRQLNDERYYKKVEKEQHNLTKLKIEECVNEIQEHNVSITKQFDMFPSTIRTIQFYILPKTH
jgi:hypothetical protein